jgi:hypothetical protein
MAMDFSTVNHLPREILMRIEFTEGNLSSQASDMIGGCLAELRCPMADTGRSAEQTQSGDGRLTV